MAIVLLLGAAVAPALADMAPLQTAQNPESDEIIRRLQPRGLTVDRPQSEPPVERQPAASAPNAAAPSASGPSAAGPGAPAQHQEIHGQAIDFSVQFELGSAELTQGAQIDLRELGRALSSSELEPYRFLIVGHTDASGSTESNQLLSQRRAESVVDFLKSEFALSSERLISVGFGENCPLTPYQPTLPVNRRVQIVNLGGVDG